MDYILKFKAQNGEFSMGGGRHDYFRLNAVSGLGFPDVERQTVTFSGRRGEKTLSARFLPRVITVSGDAVKPNVLGEIAGIISEEGFLFVNSLGGKRKIAVRAVGMEEAEKMGDLVRLVIQFTADDPAFLDIAEQRCGIYERTDLIKGSFTPPCVFTRRISGGSIINSGDLDAEPTIVIVCEKASGGTASLKLVNETVGAKIELSRVFNEGDEIFIDTKNAKITDKNGNSLISCMSDDTYLSEFVLKRGENRISVTSSEQTSDLKVYCIYQNRYLEAGL